MVGRDLHSLPLAESTTVRARTGIVDPEPPHRVASTRTPEASPGAAGLVVVTTGIVLRTSKR
jgi:hypothetical protein